MRYVVTFCILFAWILSGMDHEGQRVELAIQRIMEYSGKRSLEHNLGSHLRKCTFESNIQKAIAARYSQKRLPHTINWTQVLLHFAAHADNENDCYHFLKVLCRYNQSFAFDQGCLWPDVQLGPLHSFPLSGRLEGHELCRDSLSRAIKENSLGNFSQALLEGKHFEQQHLFVAIFYKNERLAKLLIDAGVDIDTPLLLNGKSQSMRQFALNKRCSKVVKALDKRLIKDHQEDYTLCPYEMGNWFLNMVIYILFLKLMAQGTLFFF